MPCPRPRIATRGKFAHAYYPKTYKDWIEAFAKAMKGLKFTKFETPVSLTARFLVTRPKTTKLLTPKGDLDNYAKALFDCLTKADVWTDDALIASALLTKQFAPPSTPGHIELHIAADPLPIKTKRSR